jgi:hypothetical protein
LQVTVPTGATRCGTATAKWPKRAIRDVLSSGVLQGFLGAGQNRVVVFSELLFSVVADVRVRLVFAGASGEDAAGSEGPPVLRVV